MSLTEGFIYGGDTGDTLDDLKRRREMARLMMASRRAPRNVGEGLDSFGKSIAGALIARAAHRESGELQADNERRRDEAIQRTTDLVFGNGSASASFPADTGNVADMEPGDPQYPNARIDAAHNLSDVQEPNIGDRYSVQNAKAYIQQNAGQHGLNPDTVIQGLQTEGLQPGVWQSNVVKNGVRERSYGPTQMYMGGGLGNKMLSETGLDPSDPKNWKASLDYAMPVMAKEGWKQWYGPQNSGIADPRGNAPARASSNQYAQNNMTREGFAQALDLTRSPDDGVALINKALVENYLEGLQPRNPEEMLDLQIKQAELEKARRELAGGGETGPDFENEMKLRKEYGGLKTVKDFQTQQFGYQKLLSSHGTDSAAADIAIVFGYMKLLDPTSTVREGEAASVRDTAGIPDVVRNMYNNLVEGGSLARLPPRARNEIVEAAGSIYRDAATLHGQTNEYYSGLAGQYGVDDPSRIVREAAKIGILDDEWVKNWEELNKKDPEAAAAVVEQTVTGQAVPATDMRGQPSEPAVKGGMTNMQRINRMSPEEISQAENNLEWLQTLSPDELRSLRNRRDHLLGAN